MNVQDVPLTLLAANICCWLWSQPVLSAKVTRWTLDYVTSLRGLGFLHRIVAGICEAASQQQVFQEAQVSLWTSFTLIYWSNANTGPAQIMVKNTTQGCEHQEVWSMGRLYWETSYHMKIIRILNVIYYKYASLSALKFSRYRCINIIEWF